MAKQSSIKLDAETIHKNKSEYWETIRHSTEFLSASLYEPNSTALDPALTAFLGLLSQFKVDFGKMYASRFKKELKSLDGGSIDPLVSSIKKYFYSSDDKLKHSILKIVKKWCEHRNVNYEALAIRIKRLDNPNTPSKEILAAKKDFEAFAYNALRFIGSPFNSRNTNKKNKQIFVARHLKLNQDPRSVLTNVLRHILRLSDEQVRSTLAHLNSIKYDPNNCVVNETDFESQLITFRSSIKS